MPVFNSSGGGQAPIGAARNTLNKLRRNSSDVNVLVIGDSTGDSAGEWVDLLSQTFAAKFPAYTVTYRTWSGSAYNAPTTVQVGTGAQTLAFYNASVSGTTVDRYFGAEFEAAYVTPNPDLIFVSHGHNEMSGHPAKRYRHRLIATCEMLLQANPLSSIVLIGQNPQSANNTQASFVDEVQNVSRLRGYGFVDVHQAFVEAGKAAYLADTLHPNAAGSQLWHDTVSRAIFPSGWTPTTTYPEPGAQPVSSLAHSTQNLLTNADFSSFATGTATGWTNTNVTLTTDATNYETGTYSLKITSATGAQAYIQQNVSNVRELRGQWLTFAVRMRVATGQPNATGQLHLFDNVTTELSREPFARDGFFWKTLSLRVGFAATSLSVRIFSNVGTPVSELLVDRVALVKGILPRDSRP